VAKGKNLLKHQKAGFFVSLIFPCLILFLRPLHISFSQALVLASLTLVITWWSSGITGKIPASCFLLGVFIFFGSTPLTTIFSFPLSENFYLIVFSYLFSQGIKKSGFAEKIFEPFLLRHVNTSLKVLVSIFFVLLITILIIPQPLARLIIVAEIYRNYLKKTGAPDKQRDFLLFAVFQIYAIVNGVSLNADIILNSATVGFSHLDITNMEWIRCMALPVVVFCIFAIVMLSVFERVIINKPAPLRKENSPAALPFPGRIQKKDRAAFLLIGVTVLFWITSPFHHISYTLITIAGVLLMFVFGILKIEDLRAIDIATMIFLTAAFAIGGVMKSSGIAGVFFSRIENLFPAEYSTLYILVIILVTMGMHLLLGSNTTTMSVVLPSLLIICGKGLPERAIMYIVYVSLMAHYLLPFHSVAMMIGTGNNYFPAKLVSCLGLPTMLLIFFVIFFVFLPWWRFIGLLQ
jgi:di/tricarboxylate transporter